MPPQQRPSLPPDAVSSIISAIQRERRTRQPSYADILAGRADFAGERGDGEESVGEADVERFEHLDEMSDRPANHQQESGGVGGRRNAGRGSRSGRFGRSGSGEAEDAPDGTSAAGIPLITLDQLLDPDFRLSATRPRPSPSVSPRDLSGSDGSMAIAAAAGEAGDEGASDIVRPMLSGSGAHDGPHRRRASVLFNGGGIGREQNENGSAALGVLNRSSAGSANGAASTSSATGERTTPWRRMFLHPNAPIGSLSANTPTLPHSASTDAASASASTPAGSSAGRAVLTGIAGVAARRRSTPDSAPGPQEDFTWHARPTTSSTATSASTTTPTPTTRSVPAESATSRLFRPFRSPSPPGRTSNAPNPIRRSVPPPTMLEGTGPTPVFTEQDYLDSFPGLATFAEDAHLDLGMASDPNTEPVMELDMDLDAAFDEFAARRRRVAGAGRVLAGGEGGLRDVSVDGEGGRRTARTGQGGSGSGSGSGTGARASTGAAAADVDQDLEEDMDIYTWLRPDDSYGTFDPASGVGSRTLAGADTGADLTRGGNNRRRTSLRRTAAANALTSAAGTSNATSTPSRSSPLVIGRNASGETTYAGRPAVTSQDILAWDRARALEEAEEERRGPSSIASVVEPSIGRAARDGADHAASVMGGTATNANEAGALLVVRSESTMPELHSSSATTGVAAAESPFMRISENVMSMIRRDYIEAASLATGAGDSSSISRATRIRPRSASLERMTREEGGFGEGITLGADERNKRPRLGNISPSPHDDDSGQAGQGAGTASTLVTASASNMGRGSTRCPSYLAYYPHVPESSMPSTFSPPALSSNLAITTSPSTQSSDPSGTASTSPATSRAHTTITFTSHPPPTHTDDDACAILTSLPIPSGLGVYYYEVTVKGSGPEGYMSVGFAKGDSDTNRLVGWDRGTWGYHADDGLLFEGSGKGRPFGEVWGVGDVVGAGIDFTTKRVFFTKNGKLLGTGIVPIIPSLHPAVALRNVGEQLQVNLSGPFTYDIDRYARTLKDRALESVDRHKVDKVLPVTLLSFGSEGTMDKISTAKARAAAEPAEKSLHVRTTTEYDGIDAAAEYQEMSNVGKQAGMEMALVLEYLAHKGMDKVAGLMKRDVRKRGLFDRRKREENERGTEAEATESAPSTSDKGKGRAAPKVVDAQMSIGARYRSVIASASHHPLRSAYAEHVRSDTPHALALEPRLLIIDFVYTIMRSLPGAESLPSSSPWSVSNEPAGEDADAAVSPAADLVDILAEGRALQAHTKVWDMSFKIDSIQPESFLPSQYLEARRTSPLSPPSRYLQEAVGLLALTHPLPENAERMWAQRRKEWIEELHDAIRRDMGMGERSLLEEGMQGVQGMMRVLRERGDGLAGCVGLEDVIGGEE